MVLADRSPSSAKRNDNYRPNQPSLITTITAYYRQSFRSRRRILVGLLVLVAFFVWELRPTTDAPTQWQTSWPGKDILWPLPVEDKGHSEEPKIRGAGGGGSRSQSRPGEDKDKIGSPYEGAIRFQHLTGSLESAIFRGPFMRNRNIVFAAASLESVSSLLPLACEMARWKRNKVHFAFMGRTQIPLKKLLQLNGFEKGCEAIFIHDARPDKAQQSADKRMEFAASGALKLIYQYNGPQVVIVDGSEREETYLIAGISRMAEELRSTLIQIPDGGAAALSWMTRLEAQSLAMWHTGTIDIVVHAPSYQSGTLIRLLRSLSKADYLGTPPRLTLELPLHLGDSTEEFLKSFKWPPQGSTKTNLNTLTVRRQILRRETGEERSIRFLESFYPQDLSNSHVLVLNAQSELAPNWYHYLKYTLLEYKYSSYARGANSVLMGISLEMPTTFINGSDGYEPPLSEPDDFGDGVSVDFTPAPTPYLWQAPLSSATLYFGDKWAELRSFVENRYNDPKRYDPRRQHLAPNAPAWSHYFLELARARGYILLYPNLDDPSRPFSIIHDDQQPLDTEDEISIDPDSLEAQSKAEPERTQPVNGEFVLDGPSTPQPKSAAKKAAAEMYGQFLPITKALSFSGDLPELPSMPILTYDGRRVKMKQLRQERDDYAAWFRAGIGRCSDGAKVSAKQETEFSTSADDLFCIK